MYDQHAFCCNSAHFHQWVKVSLWKQRIYFCPVILFIALRLRCLCHTVDVEEGFETAKLKLENHKLLDPFGILLCTLWHRHAHITYTVGYITQTNLRAHTPQPKKQHMHKTGSTEPQQRAAVLTGATCCYCGLYGKAGPLPAATEWTQYPNSRSYGPQASGPQPACLSCCQCSFQSFIFLAPAPGTTPSNANNCQRAKMPHSEPSLGQRGHHVFTAGSRKSDHYTTSYITDQYTQVCFLLYILLPLR